jgi:hypothetical protein
MYRITGMYVHTRRCRGCRGVVLYLSDLHWVVQLNVLQLGLSSDRRSRVKIRTLRLSSTRFLFVFEKSSKEELPKRHCSEPFFKDETIRSDSRTFDQRNRLDWWKAIDVRWKMHSTNDDPSIKPRGSASSAWCYWKWTT